MGALFLVLEEEVHKLFPDEVAETCCGAVVRLLDVAANLLSELFADVLGLRGVHPDYLKVCDLRYFVRGELFLQ